MLQLQNSLVAPLGTRPSSQITHKEITEGVDIDRPTVYRYYNHKNQVLQAAVDVRLTPSPPRWTSPSAAGRPSTATRAA